MGSLNYNVSDGNKKIVDRDLNENYGSDYTGCLFTTCRSQNHVTVDRSAGLSFPGYPSAA